MEPEDLSLQKSFRYFEWISIVLTAIAQFSWASYAVQWDQFITASFVLLSVDALLASFLLRASRFRLIQLLVQIITVSAAVALGIHQHSSILFLILGAKAALFLPRTQMFIAAAVLLAGRLLAGFSSLYMNDNAHVHHAFVPQFYNMNVVELEGKLYFAIALATVLYLGRTIISERKSRKIQEELSSEAQRIAVDLERGKIATQIHESLGHILASQLIQLELAAKLVEDRQLEKATTVVSKAYDASVECLQELRKAVSAMRESE